MSPTYTTPDPAVTDALRTLGTTRGSYGPTLDTTVSASAVETVGSALAQALGDYRPTALAIWSTGDEMVLAHVVARELSVPVSLAAEDEGIVTVAPDLASGARLALLATSWKEERRLRGLRTWAQNQGAEIVVVASVYATAVQSALGDFPTIHLTDAERSTS